MMKSHQHVKFGSRNPAERQWKNRGAAPFAGNLSRARFCKGDGRGAERELQREEQTFERRQCRNDRLRLIFKLWRIAEWPPDRIARALGILDEEVHGAVDVIEDFLNCSESRALFRKDGLNDF